MLRLIIPDSHGQFIDKAARRAVLADAKRLDPDEIVMLGDHLDCSGIFTNHPKKSLDDIDYSYQDDVAAGNDFLDELMSASPRAKLDYLEGNHEAHVERWVANNVPAKKDASFFLDQFAPERCLKLADRGVRYIRSTRFYDGLSQQGVIKKGKCFFVHGTSAALNATENHLRQFSGNVVHGHTHRARAVIGKTVSTGTIGAWCPGTLSVLQPTYCHASPTTWSHGYGLQLVNRSTGTFLHINVTISNGVSLLLPLTSLIHRKSA